MDYKSMYPEFLEPGKDEYSNKEVIEAFNKVFNRDIVPLYNGGPISGKTMMTAFDYYLSNDWDYFVGYMKEALK